MQVKSPVKALGMLSWPSCPLVFTDGGAANHELTTPSCFSTRAINNGDREALKYYFDLTVHFAGQDKEHKAATHAEAFPQWAFLLAIDGGRTAMLVDMVSWAGSGLPLEQLVENTVVELNNIPSSYPSLTLYGKKKSF